MGTSAHSSPLTPHLCGLSDALIRLCLMLQDFRRRHKLEPIVKDDQQKEEGGFEKQQRATVCDSSIMTSRLIITIMVYDGVGPARRSMRPVQSVAIKGWSTIQCS